MLKNLKHIISNLVKVLLVSLIGGAVTAPAVRSWYNTLNKPMFNPPDWAFSLAWTILFILMAISAYLVNKRAQDKETSDRAIRIYNAQLFLNLLWSVLFFGLRSPRLAFIDIIFLWCAIVYTIKAFHKIYTPSATLLIPYILWVTFAAILNLYIVLLN